MYLIGNPYAGSPFLLLNNLNVSVSMCKLEVGFILTRNVCRTSLCCKTDRNSRYEQYVYGNRKENRNRNMVIRRNV